LHLAQKMFGRAQHLCQGSEPGQQGLGHGLCVRARNEPEQQKLEKFIVGQSFVAGGGKPLPQPVAMAQIVRLFSAGSLFFKRPQWLLPEKSSDRKSTRLNSSHVKISYAVFCLKKKNQTR